MRLLNFRYSRTARMRSSHQYTDYRQVVQDFVRPLDCREMQQVGASCFDLTHIYLNIDQTGSRLDQRLRA